MATTTTLGFSILSRYSGHGVTQARRDLAALRAQMTTLNDDLQKHTKILDGIPSRWKAIGGAAALISPALIPISAAATQVAASFTAMSAAVGVSLGAYALSVKNAIDTTNVMAKAGKALSSQQKDFLKSQDALNKSFARFGQGFRDLTLKGVTDVFEGAARALDKLQSVAKAITPEINRVAAAFNNWTKSASFDNYIKIIGQAAPVAFRNLSDAARMFLNVVGDGFRAFLPLGVQMTKSIKDGAAALKQWSDGGGFQRFLAYVKENGPAVHQFWVAFRAALLNLFNTIKEFSSGSLSILTDALRGIASIDPGAVKAFANSFLLLKSPLVWLVLNCPPLRDAIVTLLGAMNAQVVYALAAAFVALRIGLIFINTTLLSTPIGWIIIGLAAIGVGITLLATKTQFFQTIWQGLVTAWNATISALSTAWFAFAGAMVTAWNATWNGIATAIRVVWDGIRQNWQDVCNFFTTIWTTVSAALVTAWNATWNGIATAIRVVWDGMKQSWQDVCNFFSTIWTTTSAALVTAWNATWNAIKVAIEATWNGLKTAWQAVCSFFGTAWTATAGALTAAWNATWNAMKVAAEAVWNALKIAWQAVASALSTAWTATASALTAAWNATWNAIKAAAQAVWDWIKSTWQTTTSFLPSTWATASSALTTAWNATWNALKGAATAVWDWMKTTWKSVTDAIGDIWDKAGKALEAAWKKTWDTVKDVATKVWDGVKDAVEKGINALLTPINFLIKGFNAIAKAVSLNIDIPEIKVNFANGGMVGGAPEFAAGGTVNFSKGGGALGGYAPGRDTVPAILSRGEGVLTPEAIRGIGGPGMLNSINRKFAGHRGAGRGAKPLHFADGGMLPASGGIGASRAWHLGSGGWGMAVGGLLPNEVPVPGGGTVGQAPGEDVNKPKGSVLDALPDDLPDPKDLLGSILGINGTNKAVLGFIGKEALDKALLPLIDKITANFGPVGEIFAGAAKKIGHGMLDKLIKEDEAKKKEYESMAVAGTQSVAAWAALAKTAMIMGGLDPSQLPKFLALMQAESSGNPNSINTTDINAKNGIPSQGLMQIIPPNFTKYHVAGTSNNILDPLANMAAAAAYIKAVYGGNVPGSPYALGTPGATSGTHLVGEKGPELVNFAGGETVTPAKQTSSILSGVGTAPAAAPAMPALPDVGSMVKQAMAGGSSEEVVAMIQEIIAAAQEMNVEVKTAWTGVTSSTQTGQSTMNPVLAQLIAQYGTNIPTALTAMNTSNTTTWAAMNAATATQWLAMQTGVFVPANAEMTTTVPTSLAAMSTANTTHWTAMKGSVDTTWAGMRDGAFTEANDHMSVKMPTWGNEMNTAVSTAWTNMGQATTTEWDGMKEGTREPTNWIIENSYNSGIRELWNQVAGVIFDDGAKELPSVAALAKGGPVYGPGTGTSDSVPARLSRGEHVWTAREVRKAGGHGAVMRMRSAALGGEKVRGAHDGHRGCGAGFALGGFLGGGVSGSSPAVGQLDLKRGSMADTCQPILDSISEAAKSALAGSPFRKMGGSSDVLSPADWISQYIKKDDELNKIGSGGPPWVPGVSDVHTTYDGYTVNARTKDMLDAAKAMGASFSVVQGSFNAGGVAASAGTHDGGGVVDVVPAGNANVGPLRGVGFAAWSRGAAYGSPSFAEHIHAVAQGDPTVSPAAASQIQSYLAGGNGLADGGPDNFSGSIPTGGATGGAAGTSAGGGKNVDPKDLEQGIVSFDRGGLLQPGYTLAFNGTRRPEPVGHNLEPRGHGGMGNVKFEVHVHGNANPQEVVDGINSQVLPKLTTLLKQGCGDKY